MAITELPWQDWWRAFVHEAELGRIELGGYQAEYFAWGNGPALVCIHGLADSYLAFFPLAALLKDRFRVIAYNLPDGHRDGARLERYSLAELARDVLRLLKQLGLPRATLIGHSFGSALALTTAYRYPHIVQRAVTICGFAHRPLRFWQKKLLRFGRLLPRRWSCLTPYHWPLRQALANVSNPADWPVVTWAAIDRDVERLAPPQPLGSWPRVYFRAWAFWACKLAQTDLRPCLPEIRVPVLVAYSQTDPLVPESCQHELLQRLPHAIGFRLAASGHFPNWSHPYLLAEALEQFHRMTTLSAEVLSPASNGTPTHSPQPYSARVCPLLQSWQRHGGQEINAV
jgi:pimeloyl-ACP methyl ester carboxylesterase